MKIINVERAILVGVLVVASAGWVGRVTAQQPSTDVLPQLLAEVKGLRAAMEQMASAGPRIQLFTSRLQLQEARINNMVRRLDTVRDSVEGAQKKTQDTAQRAKDIEVELAEHRASSSPGAREEAQQAAFMLEVAKREHAFAQAQLTRLQAEEAQLTQDIGLEQSRWADINNRLDELERALV